MSLTLTINQAAGRPFKVSVPGGDSTVLAVKEAIFNVYEDLPVDIQCLFLGDVMLPNDAVLDHAGIQDGGKLRLLRDEGSDDDNADVVLEDLDDDESVGSLKDFIVDDDVEDLTEEDDEVVEEVIEGSSGDAGPGAGAGAAEGQPSAEAVAGAQPVLRTIIRKRPRPLVDLDPENILQDGVRRNRKAVERFVPPDLGEVVSNEDFELSEDDEEDNDEGHKGESSEDEDVRSEDLEAEEEDDDDIEEDEDDDDSEDDEFLL